MMQLDCAAPPGTQCQPWCACVLPGLQLNLLGST